MTEYPVYETFADIYDLVMRDVDYDTWSQHVIALCECYNIHVKKILDLACGTGSMLLHHAAQGYDVVGMDLSKAMLRHAKVKLNREGYHIPLYSAPMNKFPRLRLARDFDLITCLYDSLNYILDEKEVIDCFEESFKHLRPGGAFIFDVTTEYNLLHNFAGYTFAENFEHASYIWENEYDIVKKICKSKVTIFHEKRGKYIKTVEMHTQRVYSVPDLVEMLDGVGFEIMGTFHNLTETPVKEKCERIHFVCQKPEN